jgi:hypothetical protein
MHEYSVSENLVDIPDILLSYGFHGIQVISLALLGHENY